MMTFSPSGGLSPYHYKGGYFHGIHYGSYFDDTQRLFDMIDRETAFILKSPQSKRVMFELYETMLTEAVVDKLISHLKAIEPRVVKLGVSAKRRDMKVLRKAMAQADLLQGRVYFGEDMEEVKTWLVK